MTYFGRLGHHTGVSQTFAYLLLLKNVFVKEEEYRDFWYPALQEKLWHEQSVSHKFRCLDLGTKTSICKDVTTQLKEILSTCFFKKNLFCKKGPSKKFSFSVSEAIGRIKGTTVKVSETF